jgi:hypothetical protein
MLEPVFQMDAIYDDRRWYGEVFEQQPLEQAPYAQVLLDSEKTYQPVDAAFPCHHLERVVRAHRRWGGWSLFWEYSLLNVRKRLGLLGKAG